MYGLCATRPHESQNPLVLFRSTASVRSEVNGGVERKDVPCFVSVFFEDYRMELNAREDVTAAGLINVRFGGNPELKRGDKMQRIVKEYSDR